MIAPIVGCDINPVPEPPSQQPIDPPNTEEVTLSPDPMMANEDIDVAGGPGAAEPGGELWAVNLDGTAPPTLTNILPDGSFAMIVKGFAGDELRLQVRLEDRRSAPIDVVVPPAPGPALPAARPLADCLLLDPSLELELPAPSGSEPPSASIAIENRCGVDVVVDEQRLRVPSTSFVVEPTSTLIPADGFGQIVVQAYGQAGAEEVLLLRIAAPQVERRPVTLISRGGAPSLQPTCEQVGGACLSDPMDPGFPADCEALGQQTLQASCVAFNTTCCISMP